MSALVLCVTGCTPEDAVKDILPASESATEKRQDLLPEIDEFDPGMSKAHFISAPVAGSGDPEAGAGSEKSSGGDTIETTAAPYSGAYTVSFKMLAENTGAYLALGDPNGQYGRVLLLGIKDREDGSSFAIKSFLGGAEDEESKCEIPLEDREDPLNVYDVSVSIDGENANISVNGIDYGNRKVPAFDLGCAGTYKSRGDDYAYIDDILIEGGGETIFADDFDGNFENRLYPYDYETPRDSVFSPFLYRTSYDTRGRSLEISSGFLLSETGSDAAPLFSKGFDIEKEKVKRAYLYMTALGSFDAYINGKKIGETFFEPGRMIFDEYLDYVTLDVTDYLEDRNELELYLFHGFFDKGVGYPEEAAPWGERLALKGELVVVYDDDTTVIIPTDKSFCVDTDTRYRLNDIYRGEIIDDRYEGEEAPEEPVFAVEDDLEDKFLKTALFAKKRGGIKTVKELSCIGPTEPVPGHYVYDFGENCAAILSVDPAAIQEKSGNVISFSYGEQLNSDLLVNSDGPEGTVWRKNLFTAESRDYYICGEEPPKELTFSHTYHGFRYLEITGTKQPIPAEALKALAISSDVKQTGEFNCANEDLMKYYEASVRSFRSNLMDVPTDCAQRDERLGWTGDAGAVSEFALYSYDMRSFYDNYLKEIRYTAEDGMICDIAPSLNHFGGHSAWGDIITILPWNMYLQSGDIEIIKENIEAASEWVDYISEEASEYIYDSEGYGDHLSSQGTLKPLNDTAWCAHSADITARMYSALGDEENAAKYAGICDKFKNAWQKAYIRENPSKDEGILKPENESVTAYVLGISFGMFPEELREDAAYRLDILAEAGGFTFAPGYSGMTEYLPVLAEYGYGEAAAKILTNSEPGGLLHPVSMGLTANPEEISCFNYADENGEPYTNGRYLVSGSLDHAAYSSVAAYCYSGILGIIPDENEPGYRHFYIKPQVSELVGSASGKVLSPYGEISVAWDCNTKELSCLVPEGTTCSLTLPGGEDKELTPGEYKYNW